MKERGYTLLSVDSTVVAEEPLLAPYIDRIKETICEEVGSEGICINIKAKTNEGLGSIGRREGIAAYAVCLIAKVIK